MKNNGLLVGVMIFGVILTGCSRPGVAEIIEEKEKTPYFVDVVSVGELKQGSSLKKTGRIIGAQDIIVSSQIAGRVSEVRNTIGETVGKDALVIKLTDSSGAYTFAAQRANASLQQANISYEQSLLSLNKAITDTSLAIKQAKNQSQNSALGLGDSSAELQLKQLEQSLSAAKQDLQTKIDSDQQTIENFSTTAKSLVDSVQLLYEDVIVTSDKLLGVTPLNERENDLFESYLGARNTATKSSAVLNLRQLLIKQQLIENYDESFNANNIETKLNEIQSYVNDLMPLLDSIDLMLTFTISSQTFPQSQLDGLIARIDGLQLQVQGQNSSITQQINGIKSFLRTYQQQQESIKTNISALEKQVAGTKESLKTVSVNADLGLESAQNAYENTLQNKSTTQAALLNAITQAKIASAQAQNDLAKLTVETPISGRIKDILVDVGQEVGPGNPLFSIDSSEKQQIEIALSQNELQRVKEGQTVTVINDNNSYDATLTSISQSANNTLSYKVIVNLNENAPLLGSVASIEIPLQSDAVLLPLKNIKIINTTQGIIYVYKDSTSVEEKTIQLGKIRGTNIEVLSQLQDNLEIITTDISNFNESEFELKRKSAI